MKCCKILLGLVASVGIIIGTVISSLYFIKQEQKQATDTQVSDFQKEISNQKHALSEIQKEISEEATELFEDQLYDLIVKLDNSSNYSILEDKIMDRVEAQLSPERKQWLIKTMGIEYVEMLYKQAYFKIRSKIDRQYDVDNYIEDIVDDILPKIDTYRREIIRRYVMDLVYERVDDSIIQTVANELVDEARVQYATKVKEKLENEIEQFVSGDSEKLPTVVPAVHKR